MSRNESREDGQQIVKEVSADIAGSRALPHARTDEARRGRVARWTYVAREDRGVDKRDGRRSGEETVGPPSSY